MRLLLLVEPEHPANDPVGLTELGELHLDQGKLDEAVANLKLALDNVKADTPPAVRGRARSKLYETLTEYFQSDFVKAEQADYLKVYEQLCKVTPATPAL